MHWYLHAVKMKAVRSCMIKSPAQDRRGLHASFNIDLTAESPELYYARGKAALT